MEIGKVDTIIKNGKLVFSTNIIEAGVAIDDGKIVQIAHEKSLSQAENTIDARGKLVFPGLVDPHQHLLQQRSESSPKGHDFEMGTRAAAFGGTTTSIDFAYQHRVEKSPKETFKRAFEKAKQSNIDFTFHGGFTGYALKTYEDLRNFVDLGLKHHITSFKTLMPYGKREQTIPDDMLYDSFMYCRQKGALSLVYAENPHLWDYYDHKLEKDAKDNEYLIKYWARDYRPNFIEVLGVNTAIVLARATDQPIYLTHVATKEGLQAVRVAKRAGQRVYAEVNISFLCFSEEDYERLGPYLKTEPAIRSKEDKEALWRGILDGTVSVVDTDHISMLKELKDKGWNDWLKAPGGFPSYEEKLPAFYNEAVNKRGLSPTLVTRLMCEKPAKLMGLYPKKGSFMIGADADFVILDPEKERTLRAEEMQVPLGYTLFEGMKVKGVPTLTMLRGKVLVEDGKFYGHPGYGSFVPREPFGSYAFKEQ